MTKYVSRRTTKKFKEAFFKALQIYEQNFTRLNLTADALLEISVNVFRFYIKKYFKQKNKELQKFIGVLLLHFEQMFPGEILPYSIDYSSWFILDTQDSSYFSIAEKNLEHFERVHKKGFIRDARNKIATKFPEIKMTDEESQRIIDHIINMDIKHVWFHDPKLKEFQVMIIVLLISLFQTDPEMVPDVFIPFKDEFNPKDKTFETRLKIFLKK